MNVKELHKGIRRVASGLDPESAALDAQEYDPAEKQYLNRSRREIWLVSKQRETVGSIAGQVVSAVPMIAARWLQEETHELASPEQVAAHKTQLGASKERIEKEEADRKGVPTSKLLEALTATLAASTGASKRDRS